ncbi:MAG: hypothetical protein F2914_03675, partial [Actinobacteria bacterium]|nr:hypothetical protein [Actinomycetota bacterium]
MADEIRKFKDIRVGLTTESLPVDEFMAELDHIQGSVCVTRNQLWSHVADGTLSEEHLRRFCKEYYFLGVTYTGEFASLVANAPDPDALTLDQSEHFAHWIQNLADETGY